MSKKIKRKKKEKVVEQEMVRDEEVWASFDNNVREEFCQKQYKEEQAKATAFEKWEAWWKLQSEWYTEPGLYETWNGCVDTMCQYFKQILHGTESQPTISEIEEIIEKAKKKFNS